MARRAAVIAGVLVAAVACSDSVITPPDAGLHLDAGLPMAGSSGMAGMPSAGAAGFAGGTSLGGGGGTGGTGVGGGAGLGGSAGVGGAGTAGMGGMPSSTCDVSFLEPSDGATLTESDDEDGDCRNGIAVDVRIDTDAPTGATVELIVGQTIVGTTTTSDMGQAQFDAVGMNLNGDTTLTARVDAGIIECSASIEVATECDAPTCVITQPSITGMHPKLNGIPITEGGDRASPMGQPYKTHFTVTTNVADGQPVALSVGGVVLLGQASGGFATFNDVELGADGAYTAQATCTDESDVETVSDELDLVLDTQAPGIGGLPAEGAHFGPEDDADSSTAGLQFEFCASTSDADAIDLPDSLGSGQNNLRVAVGTATPQSAPMVTDGNGSSDGACILVDCNGSAPQDYTVRLLDDAGNVNERVVRDITCADAAPSVQIVDPVAQDPNDPDTHILAAGNGTARVDQLLTAGAQYTVVACTDVDAGTAELFAWVGADDARPGSPSATSTSITAAVGGDGCPGGLPYVVRFTNVTLPQSQPDPTDGTLQTPTRLEVDVTANSETGTSPQVETWVDTVAPSMAAIGITNGGSGSALPPLCGREFPAGTRMETVRIATSVAPVTLTVDNGGQIYSQTVPAMGLACSGACADFTDVLLEDGTNTLTFSATEPSGNLARFSVVPCTVQLGATPVVAFLTPQMDDVLNAQGGTGAIASTGSSPGTWEGDLSVDTDLEDEATCDAGTCTVEFFAGAASLGTALVDPDTGVATLSGAMVDDGQDVTLRAVTEDFGVGVGQAQIVVPIVDTIVPRAVTSLAAAVTSPRGTDFQLSWTAQSDGPSPSDPQSASEYVMAFSTSTYGATPEECQANAAAAPAVTISSSAQTNDTVTGDLQGLSFDTDYYFAVAPLDDGGNQGEYTCLTTPESGTFVEDVIVSPSVQGGAKGYGINIDGSSDLGGPTTSTGAAIHDVLVGSLGREVFLHMGSESGLSPTHSVRFFDSRTDPFSMASQFGYDARVVGDINGDAYPDIAIGAPLGAFPYGVVYVYLGSASGWGAVATLNESQADATITADTGFDPDGGARFGLSLAPLGDVNADGYDDFAVGAPHWGTSDQGRVVVIWGRQSFTSFTLSQAGQETRRSYLTCPAAICNTSGGREFFYFGRKVAAAPGVNGSAHSIAVSVPGFPQAQAAAVVLFSYAAGSYSLVGSYDYYAVAGGPSQLGASLSMIGGMPNGTAIAAGAPVSSPGQRTFVFLGDDTSVFSSFATVLRSNPIVGADRFGVGTMGTLLFQLTPAPSNPTDQLLSGFSEANLVGDGTGDLVVAGIEESGATPNLYVIDGDNLTAAEHLAGDIADVILPFPASWAVSSGATFGSSVVRDVNGDGQADVIVGENDAMEGQPEFLQPSNAPGRIWVVY